MLPGFPGGNAIFFEVVAIGTNYCTTSSDYGISIYFLFAVLSEILSIWTILAYVGDTSYKVYKKRTNLKRAQLCSAVKGKNLNENNTKENLNENNTTIVFT